MKETVRRRPWLKPLLVTVGIFLTAAAVFAYVFLVEWVDVIDVRPAEVEAQFAAALVEAGGGQPYIEITDGDEVVIHHELESPQPRPFDTLTLLAWTPSDGRILRIDYPRWFVRLKTYSSYNLGTAIAMFRRDWEHIDLSIRYKDLQRRGPGLLLDHDLANGARLMLWTSVKG